MAKTIVTSSETGTGKFVQRIEAGAHRLIGDEPVAVGGSDSGPTPTQLMLASLASCTSMTLRYYAAHKNWPLGAVRVEVSHERAKGETGATYDRFERTIHVADELTDEQRAKLLEIADKCPMHKLLMAADKAIDTRVV